jgi:cytochrome c oxidase subunit 3
MVLAVNYGHKMQKNKVILWLSLTILGGVLFIGSQAWEWSHFIHGDKGGINTELQGVVHIAVGNEMASVYELMGVDGHDGNHYEFEVSEVIQYLEVNPQYNIILPNRDALTNQESMDYLNDNGTDVMLGANLRNNEYGHRLFADYFYFITGFHGFHVFSGVVILTIILINVIKGTYEKRGHYEMVEKVGLYWHFVDLVWVFVFTFFYLV